MGYLGLPPRHGALSLERSLPPEVWERCWGHCNNHQLRLLVSVCRLFRDICQPLLFSQQTFRAPNSYHITPRNWLHAMEHVASSAFRLQRVRHSRHISSVLRLKFMGCFELDVSWMFPAAQDMSLLNHSYLLAVQELSGALFRYTGLRVLHLSNLTIGAELRQAFSQLPRLIDLTLEDCDIACRIAPLLPLRRLSISGLLSDESGILHPLSIVTPLALQTLSLHDSPDGDSVLCAFIPGEVFHDLIDLQISVTAEIAPRFFNFLLDCPGLQHISILSAPGSLSHDLHSTAIPHLSSFYGPVSLAEMFVCGRPVEKIELTHPSDVRPVNPVQEIIAALSSVTSNSVPLASLSLPPIPPDPFWLSAISARFPHLHEFRVDVLGPSIYQPATHIVDGDDEDVNSVDDYTGFCEQCEDTMDVDEDAGLWQSVAYETVILNKVSIRLPVHETVPQIGLHSEGQPMLPPRSFAGLMDSICRSNAQLPRKLRVLSIRQLDSHLAPFTIPEQCRVIVELANRMSDLRRVKFAENSDWTLRDRVWMNRCWDTSERQRQSPKTVLV
ncbi:hypothetical protein B0H15DRAFT_294187 [Mycena belliarum]|uniref:F-box domain-containing protein n=1 Tax=Mycena belliarum TaxID=1033014 RepID=A0AAD6XRP1_9AGAR|nr:hypothetical protein B0H15DRAFT_294187 [Mycena belliae]